MERQKGLGRLARSTGPTDPHAKPALPQEESFATGGRDIHELLAQLKDEARDIDREEFARNQQIFAAYLRGRLAVQQKRYDDARSQAARIETLAREDRDPLAVQNAHALRGYVALAHGDARQAIMHLEKSSLANVYNRYSLALARHAAGQHPESAQLFREVANYNFNNADFAVARKDAWERTR